ncbi:uncharacterized [Tachysurus ichikawai]
MSVAPLRHPSSGSSHSAPVHSGMCQSSENCFDSLTLLAFSVVTVETRGWAPRQQPPGYAFSEYPQAFC